MRNRILAVAAIVLLIGLLSSGVFAWRHLSQDCWQYGSGERGPRYQALQACHRSERDAWTALFGGVAFAVAIGATGLSVRRDPVPR